MNRSFLNRNYAVVTALIAAVIIYGSLYPFEFRVPANGIGPLHTFLNTWADRPGRGDFVSNILLYLPLGYFGFLASSRQQPAWRRSLLVTAIGAVLSLTVELTQYYDEGRVTAVSDFYSNVIGAAVGAICAQCLGARVRWSYLRDLSENREPTLLLIGWLGYRLFPYVPTIDLHKYWDALKPVVLYPSLPSYMLFQHTVVWVATFALLEAIFRGRRLFPLLFLFVGCVLFARILIITTVLSLSDIAGAGLALALWLILGISKRLRLLAVTIAFAAMVIAERLEPFHLAATAGHFGWIPFNSFMRGSINVDVLSFFEKFFLYGTMIWLLVRVGISLRLSTGLVAIVLLATSVAEIYLPGRSGEITDALMSLMIAGIARLSARNGITQPLGSNHPSAANTGATNF